MLTEKKLNFKLIIIHILSWLLFFVFVIFTVRPQYPNIGFGLFFIKQLVVLMEMLFVFYLNYFYLAPKILKSPKLLSILNMARVIGFFFLCYCLSAIIRFTLSSIAEESLTIGQILISSIRSLGAILFFFVLSTGVQLIKHYNDSRLEKAELQELAQRAKLEALKAKVNPHFLYNAFNTLYALSEIKSKLMSEAILKLSDIMRYLLNNSSNAKISIYEELNFIQNFIDFQKFRIQDPEEKITVLIEEPPSDYLISPTLLVSFIENAFKHSNLVLDNCKITVKFKTTQSGFIYYVTNRVIKTTESESGTGNKNLKKILDIEYGDQYELKTWLESGFYHASLSIDNI